MNAVHIVQSYGRKPHIFTDEFAEVVRGDFAQTFEAGDFAFSEFGGGFVAFSFIVAVDDIFTIR